MKKKFIKTAALISAWIYIISCVGYAAPKDNGYSPDMAIAKLTDKTELINFAKVKSGTGEQHEITERGGESCWLMNNTIGGELLSYINFDVDDNFAHNVSNGDVFEIEIDYYDKDNGYFYLEYDSQFKEMKIADIVYVNNDETWKTIKYTIDDAYFGGRVDGGYDFRLAIKPWLSNVYISPGAVAVKEVRVKKIPEVNKIWSTSSTDESGNSFEYYKQEKIIHNTLKNLTNEPIEADVTFKAVSTSGHTEFEKTERIEFAPNEEKKVDVNVATDKCDLYDWYVGVKSENPQIDSSMNHMRFAILKTDPNGYRNEHSYMSTHVERYLDQESDILSETMSLISKSNSVGIRQSLSWDAIEPQAGKYKWEDTSVAKISEKADDYNLKTFWQISTGHPTITGLWSNIVQTEEEKRAFVNYLRFAVEKIKDFSVDYEVGNEPDISYFNTRNLNAKQYSEIAILAAKTVKEIDPDAVLHAYGFTGIKYNKDWEWINDGVSVGVMDYIDCVSYHPYSNTESVEKSGNSESARRYYDLIRQYNPDAGLSITELGNTTADTAYIYDERSKGSNQARMMIHYLSRDVSDILIHYNFELKGLITKRAREDGFGLVNLAYDRASDDSGRTMIPLEAFLSYTAMNYALGGTEPEGIYDVDNNIKISGFNSKKFGGKVLAMNTVDTPMAINVDLGIPEIIVMDDYGNEETVVSENGVYNLSLDDRPLYVIGDYKKCEVADKAPVSIDKGYARVADGDTVDFVFTAEDGGDYEIDVNVPERIELLKAEDIVGGKGLFSVKTSGNKDDYYLVNVKVRSKSDGKVYFAGQIRLVVSEPIDSSFDVKLISDSKIDDWNAVFEVTNFSYSSPARGYIKIKSPSVFKDVRRVDIGLIPPGMTAQVECKLPKIIKKGMYPVEYEVVTEEFGRKSFVMTKDFSVGTHVKDNFVLDGVLKADEWPENAFMYADTIERVKNIADWRGPGDLSMKTAVMWDEENVYIAVEVTDDVFCQEETAGNTWKGDGLQIGIFYGEQGHAAIGQRSATFHEICVANTKNGPEIYRTLSQDGAYENGYIKNAKAVIKCGEKNTVYEVVIPWKNLLLEGQQPALGEKLGFSILANDNDGSGRRGWIEYASGIGASKNTELFTYLNLTDVCE